MVVGSVTGRDRDVYNSRHPRSSHGMNAPTQTHPRSSKPHIRRHAPPHNIQHSDRYPICCKVSCRRGTRFWSSGDRCITSPLLGEESGTGLQLSDGDGEQLDIATLYEGFSETSVSSNESRGWQDTEKARNQCSSRSDIVAWSNMITDENEKTSSKVTPLTPTPFENGIIGGLSTNDLLMIKGLIDPGLYVQYLHILAAMIMLST
jgi:hypothetical protein